MVNSDFSLLEKRILVTGASSGIGKETAIQLAKAGAVLIISGRNEQRLIETMESLEGNNHKIFVGDLTKEEKLNELVDEIEGLEGMVLAAGVVKTLPIKFLNRDELNSTMSANFESPVLLCQKLIKKKKISKKGSIVFISSIAGNLIADKGNAAYAASKGALNAFCKVLSLELAPQKIRVNCVSPGMVWTPLTQNELTSVSQEQLAINQKLYPLGYGEAIDVANAALFLLADASKWITGTSLVIDGGFSIQ